MEQNRNKAKEYYIHNSKRHQNKCKEYYLEHKLVTRHIRANQTEEKDRCSKSKTGANGYRTASQNTD
jgi:hypothetical protein